MAIPASYCPPIRDACSCVAKVLPLLSILLIVHQSKSPTECFSCNSRIFIYVEKFLPVNEDCEFSKSVLRNERTQSLSKSFYSISTNTINTQCSYQSMWWYSQGLNTKEYLISLKGKQSKLHLLQYSTRSQFSCQSSKW